MAEQNILKCYAIGIVAPIVAGMALSSCSGGSAKREEPEATAKPSAAVTTKDIPVSHSTTKKQALSPPQKVAVERTRLANALVVHTVAATCGRLTADYIGGKARSSDIRPEKYDGEVYGGTVSISEEVGESGLLQADFSYGDSTFDRYTSVTCGPEVRAYVFTDPASRKKFERNQRISNAASAVVLYAGKHDSEVTVANSGPQKPLHSDVASTYARLLHVNFDPKYFDADEMVGRTESQRVSQAVDFTKSVLAAS